MNRRKRTIGVLLLLLLALIGPPVCIIYREMRQARLDHALIAATEQVNRFETLFSVEDLSYRTDKPLDA